VGKKWKKTKNGKWDPIKGGKGGFKDQIEIVNSRAAGYGKAVGD